jgi:hypothetical protein
VDKPSPAVAEYRAALVHFACALLKDYSLDVPLATLTEIAERNQMTPDEVAWEHAQACRLLWANVRGQWLGEPALERVAATLDVPGEAYLPADVRGRGGRKSLPVAKERGGN